MGRWTGSWISGPAAAGVDSSLDQPRGERLGLPAEGRGSVASLGRRVGALVVDLALSSLVTMLFTGVPHPGERPWNTLVFALMYVFFTAAFGQTPGMRLFGLQVLRLDTGRPLGLVRAAARTLLLCLIVPALLMDRDGRGLHDRAVASVVVSG